MRNFTAIQNTETIKGMGYGFKAENLKEAIKKAPLLLTGEIIEVYELDEFGDKIETEINTVITYLTKGVYNPKTNSIDYQKEVKEIPALIRECFLENYNKAIDLYREYRNGVLENSISIMINTNNNSYRVFGEKDEDFNSLEAAIYFIENGKN